MLARRQPSFHLSLLLAIAAAFIVLLPGPVWAQKTSTTADTLSTSTTSSLLSTPTVLPKLPPPFTNDPDVDCRDANGPCTLTDLLQAPCGVTYNSSIRVHTPSNGRCHCNQEYYDALVSCVACDSGRRVEDINTWKGDCQILGANFTQTPLNSTNTSSDTSGSRNQTSGVSSAAAPLQTPAAPSSSSLPSAATTAGFVIGGCGLVAALAMAALYIRKQREIKFVYERAALETAKADARAEEALEEASRANANVAAMWRHSQRMSRPPSTPPPQEQHHVPVTVTVTPVPHRSAVIEELDSDASE